jgi:hypothetical protein
MKTFYHVHITVLGKLVAREWVEALNEIEAVGVAKEKFINRVKEDSFCSVQKYHGQKIRRMD